MDIPEADVDLEDLWVVTSTGYMMGVSMSAGPYIKRETAVIAMDAFVVPRGGSLTYQIMTVYDYISARASDAAYDAVHDGR